VRPPIETSAKPNSAVTAKAYIIDGDTIAVKGRRVRLHGIDAPEMDQRGGAAARAHLFKLIAGRAVTVFPIDVDLHGRTVARVEVAGIDICGAMVTDGFAVAYSRYSTRYVEAERAARAARRGLWAECPFTGIKSPAAHRYQSRLRLNDKC
jgi:endonuclease YncB( thermonuclease family)